MFVILVNVTIQRRTIWQSFAVAVLLNVAVHARPKTKDVLAQLRRVRRHGVGPQRAFWDARAEKLEGFNLVESAENAHAALPRGIPAGRERRRDVSRWRAAHRAFDVVAAHTFVGLCRRVVVTLYRGGSSMWHFQHAVPFRFLLRAATPFSCGHRKGRR